MTSNRILPSFALIVSLLTPTLVAKTVEAHNDPSIGLTLDYKFGLQPGDLGGDIIVCVITLGFRCGASRESPGIGLQGNIPFADDWSVIPSAAYYVDYDAALVGVAVAYRFINEDDWNLFLALGAGLGFAKEENIDTGEDEMETFPYPDVRLAVEYRFAEQFHASFDLYLAGARLGIHYAF